MRFLLRCTLFSITSALFLSVTLWATPPFGDPNQPYDQLPGTLETPHVPWARPCAGGPLRALFILPYSDAREVVEISQRLELDYTVIMNAGHTAWEEGYSEGDTTTPLVGVEAKLVLESLVKERLSLENRYDVIVIGKVSWAVIPPAVRSRILEHVARGTGLVCVTPHRLNAGYSNRTVVAEGRDPLFERLFETGEGGPLETWIRQSTPLDTLPIQPIAAQDSFEPLAGVPPHDYAQTTLRLTTSQHELGRVVGLDYFDAATARRHSNSLTPYWNHPSGDHDAVAYDFSFAILARCLLWSTRRQAAAHLAITLSTPQTTLTAPQDPAVRRLRWHAQVPHRVVARQSLSDARVEITAATDRADSLQYQLRTREGAVVQQETLPWAPAIQRSLPILPRGDYLIDVRLLDKAGAVLDFASQSFRVEAAQRVDEITLDRPWYEVGQNIRGTLHCQRPLAAGQTVEVHAVDTWGRTVATATLHSVANDLVEFSIPVRNPLSELWDIVGQISDPAGIVDVRSIPAPIPNRSFEDYMFMLIFSPTPGRSHWKGDLYGRLMRKYGINSTFTYLIYSYQQQFVQNARHHLRSVAYAEHHGEILSPADDQRDPNQEQADFDLVEISRMLRRVAATGEKLDPREFPFRMQYIGAEFINGRIDQYKQAARFGSPFYTLTGENYLSGEFSSRENSGFGATTTRVFQAWCRQQYGDDLAKLNAEWNTPFDSWEQVRGILLTEAVEQDQLPRWVDFRYFMRSRVWSQYFIDLTKMMRRFIPHARTGRVGHDHHDFSRYRHEMTCSKLYIGQEIHPQWRHAMTVELPQSFAAERSFLMAPQSVLRWNYDHQSPVHRERYPWLVLMLGLNGFDWENCLHPSTLGGLSCFTPDFSEALPFFKDYAREVRSIQRGIGKLTIAAQPQRAQVALLWAPYNHYISRLLPFEENGFSGTWLSNISVIGGAPADALTLLNSIRLRPTIIAPEDLQAGILQQRGFRALVLPYNKGMSPSEVVAIREFVAEGGLVIAANDPATYTQHGRPLEEGQLADLFPVTDQRHLQPFGKGQAAYLPNLINGYTQRLENGDFGGAEVVVDLLHKHANQQPPLELVDAAGHPRYDIFTRVFQHGSTQLIGLLATDFGEDQKMSPVQLKLPAAGYVYDVRTQSLLGFTDRLERNIDLRPQFLAILPVRVESLELTGAVTPIRPGTTVTLTGRVHFNDDAQAETTAQAVHVRVLDAQDHELEWFRQNVVFSGTTFQISLPLALSLEPGRYRVRVEHAIAGSTATTTLEVTAP